MPYKIVDRGIETDPDVLRLLDEHDREDELAGEMRVNIRWGRDQVNIIKKAAKLLDVPYQVYIKQLAIKQALVDIREVEDALAATHPGGALGSFDDEGH